MGGGGRGEGAGDRGDRGARHLEQEGAQKLYKLRSLSSTPPENLSSAPWAVFL